MGVSLIYTKIYFFVKIYIAVWQFTNVRKRYIIVRVSLIVESLLKNL